MLVVLTGHQLVHEFVGTFDDLVDLLDLTLLQLLVAHSLVFAVLFYRAAQGVAQRTVVWLLDWRFVERKREWLERVHIGQDVDVFIADCYLLFLLFLLE